MTSEARKMVDLAIEIMLLGALVLIVSVAASIGRNSVNTFSEQQAMRPELGTGIELTRGTIGYYELTDIVDFYSTSLDVNIDYMRNGTRYKLTFTTSTEGGRAGDGTVRLLVDSGTGAPVQYRRASGVLYRNDIKLTADGGYELLATDMGLSPGTLKALRTVPGNGMLGYEFTQALFEWAINARFVCTVLQTYDSSNIEAITLSLL